MISGAIIIDSFPTLALQGVFPLTSLTLNQELLLAATAGAGSGHVAGAGATELPLLGQC